MTFGDALCVGCATGIHIMFILLLICLFIHCYITVHSYLEYNIGPKYAFRSYLRDRDLFSSSLYASSSCPPGQVPSIEP